MIYVITREFEHPDMYDSDLDDIVFATVSKDKAEAKLLVLNELEVRARNAREEYRIASRELDALQYPKFSHSVFRGIFRPGKQKELYAAWEKTRDDWQVRCDAKRKEIASKFNVDVAMLTEYDRAYRIREFEDEQ